MKRAVTIEPDPVPLTSRQQEVYRAITEYCSFLHTETCPASYIADRFGLSYETVRRDYFGALHRKGWLQTPAAPARPYLCPNSRS